MGRSYNDQAAVTKMIELVGENAWQIRKLGYDLGEDVNLSAIAGMRHRMVHQYEGINWSYVEEVAFEDIPELLARFEAFALAQGIELPEVTDG